MTTVAIRLREVDDGHAHFLSVGRRLIDNKMSRGFSACHQLQMPPGCLESDGKVTRLYNISLLKQESDNYIFVKEPSEASREHDSVLPG